MKGVVMENRHIIECSCGMSQELVIFDLYKEEGKAVDISIAFTDCYQGSIFGRIKAAFKFIFSKERFYRSGVMFDKKNIEELEAAIKDIKESI